MKQLYISLIYICFLISGNSVSAQYIYTPYTDARNKGVSKKHAKPLKEIEKTLQTIKVYNPDITHCEDIDSFWCYIQNQTNDYNNYTHKIAIKNKFAIKTRDNLLRNIYNPVGSSELSFLTEYLSGRNNPLISIVEINSSTLNASVGPHGNIEITTGLLSILELDEITGILAHETAHHKLKHIEIGNYAHKKRERSNNTLAIIGAGVSAAADGYAAGMSGTNVDYNKISRRTESFMDAAREDALKYRYYISRENEVEADIAAMRFLQFRGINPINYINALEKIITFGNVHINISGIRSNNSNIYDTHPSLRFRIAILYSILLKESEISLIPQEYNE